MGADYFMAPWERKGVAQKKTARREMKEGE
jgi:hypothetical protein